MTGQSTRQHISVATETALTKYLGTVRCVATDDSVSVEWHHLDDDNSNSAVANLVPLTSRLNKHLGGLAGSNRSSCPPPLVQYLSPERLSGKAADFAHRWEVGLSYAAARLAYYVDRLYLSGDVNESASRLLVRAALTLEYLRHRPNDLLTTDVIRRDVQPLLDTGKISSDSAATILFEMARIYGDRQRFREATDIYDIVAPYQPADDGTRIANVLRRRSVAALNAGLIDRRAAIASLGEAAEMAPENINRMATISLMVALVHLADGDSRACLDELAKWQRHISGVRRQIAEQFGPIDPMLLPSIAPANLAHLMKAHEIAHLTMPRRRWRTRPSASALSATLFNRSGAMLTNEVPIRWDAVIRDGIAQDPGLAKSLRLVQLFDLPGDLSVALKQAVSRALRYVRQR